MKNGSNGEICGVMADMSTLASFIGAGAKLAGFEEISWACGHLKLPLLIPSLFQKGGEGWGKRPFTSMMRLSGGMLMSGKVFQKISGVELGALFNGVANAQGGAAIFLMGLQAGRRAASPDEKHRLDQGATCLRRALTLVSGGLEGVGFSPMLIAATRLMEGGIGTGQVYWKLRQPSAS